MTYMRSFIMLAVLYALLNGITEGADKTKSAPAAGMQELPGDILVSMLLDEELRSEAYYELERRRNPNHWKDYNDFYSHEYNLIDEVIICPQVSGKPPIYMVVNKWFSDVDTTFGYSPSDPEKLFPRTEKHLKRKDAPFDLFTVEGKSIEPYGCGYMVDEGFIGDLNGDGLIELVENSHTGWSEMNADVVVVSSVLEEPKYILGVVYNWYTYEPPEGYYSWNWFRVVEKNQWWFDVTDRDEDGLFEIELGPATADSVEPKVTFRWDKKSKQYVCAEGKKGDHFIVIDCKDINKEAARIYDEGFRFKTFIAGVKAADSNEADKGYRYKSLKKLTNEEIAAYMGTSTREASFSKSVPKVPNQLPKDFWKISPKKAALSLADINRLPEHKKAYKLAIDDLDGKKPSAVCSVAYMNFSQSLFLRCDPKDSYLFMGHFERVPGYYWGYFPGYLAESKESSRLSFMYLRYEDAKTIAEILWWLNRVRSYGVPREIHGGRSVCTIGQRFGRLRIACDEKKDIVKAEGTIWLTEAVSLIWEPDYDEEVYLSFVDYIVRAELDEHLKRHYSLYESKTGYYPISTKKGNKKNVRKFKENARKAFRLFSPDERKISLYIVESLVEVVGDAADKEFKSDLQKLLGKLPPRDEKRLKELEEKRKKWEEELDSFELKIEELFDESADANSEDMLLSEHENLEITEEDKKFEELEGLREAIVNALKKIEAGTNLNALEKLATEDLSRWAAARLKKADPNRYVKAIEAWLPEKEAWEQEAIFKEIAEIKPERAKAIARKLRAEDKGNLAIVSLEYLEKQDGEAVREGDPIVEAVIQSVLDPNVGGGFSSHAMEVLVPFDDPKRYQTKRIDELLLKIVGTPRKDDTLGSIDFEYIRVDAWHALARRDGAKHFDRLMRAIKRDSEEISDFEKMISAVTLAAQKSGKKEREELLNFLKVHLERTAFPIDPLFWSAWAAGLKELKPRLEQIATSGPDVIEDDNMRIYGAKRELKGRSHLVRKIVSLWNEEDLVTRAKLLIAFGFEHEYDILYADSDVCTERFKRLKQDLSDIADSLSEKQRSEVLSFIRWCEKHRGEGEANQYYQEETTSLARLLRDILNKQVQIQ